MSLETPQNKLFCSHFIVLGQQSKSKSISTLYSKRPDGGILVGVCYHDDGWVSDELNSVVLDFQRSPFSDLMWHGTSRDFVACSAA